MRAGRAADHGLVPRCHRDPAPTCGRRDEIFYTDWTAADDQARAAEQLLEAVRDPRDALTDCSVCHR